MMKILTERQNKILSIIVNSYVDTAEPVGSRSVAKNFDVDISPATVRNEMSDLEEAGFVRHPHTSAGRMPTDLGYRYFIDNLAQKGEIAPPVLANISKELSGKIRRLDELVERTSRILAAITQQAALVSYPLVEDLSFRQISLQALEGRNILVIWCTTSGMIHDQVIDMEEEIPAEALKQIANFFNHELAGMAFCEMPGEIQKKLSARKDSLFLLCHQALQIVEEGLERIRMDKVCLEGFHHMLEQPEFQNIARSRMLFQALEDRQKLLGLMRKSISQDGVQVHVGRENEWEPIWDCSLITSAYRTQDGAVGVLGVLGPSRMHYGTLISFVDCVSNQLGAVYQRWM